jgi:RNA polymerase sigma factor (sigma-70 family)
LTHSRGEEVSDRALLDRFRESREGNAFAGLLQRHGPMVLALAHRVVRDAQAAEDIFQAAFLTLARKAQTIRRPEALAAWLHGVTYRLALRVRHSRLRRRQQERHARTSPPPTPLDELTAAELLAVLDEELQRLHETYRGPVVLCYLEGLSQEEAARRLGCSAAALKGRLERGRAWLRLRLQKRGLELPAVLAWSLLVSGATAAVPPAAARATLKAALDGGAPSAAALTHGGLLLTFLPRLKAVGIALVLLLLAGTGLGVMVLRSQGGRDSAGPAAAAPPRLPAAARGQRVDLHGDPLPEGAVMRLGTIQRRAVGATLAVSADGKSLIGVRAGKYVSVWDSATGKLRERHTLPAESWSLAVLSPDGRWLLTDQNQGSRVTFWEVRTGKAVQKWTIKGARFIMPAAFSPDGKRVAAVGNRGKQHFVRAWDLASGKEVFAKDVSNDAGSDQLAFTPNGKRLLASFMSIEEGMYCWDITTGKQVWQNKEFVPSSLVITPDGIILSAMGTLPVLNLATGRTAALKKRPPLTWGTRLTLTPNGRILLLATRAGLVVWDLVRGKELRTLAGVTGEVAVAPDGKTFFTNNGALQRWDLATGKPLYADNYQHGHIGEVLCVALSVNGKRLVSGSADGSVRLWDITTGKPLHVWGKRRPRRPLRFLELPRAAVSALDITPDGRWVLSAGNEDRLRLRDGSTGNEVRSIRLPRPDRGQGEWTVYHLRINDDGTRAVGLLGAEGLDFIAGEEPPKHTDKLATWDLKTGRLLTSRPVERTQAIASALGPDGRTLLSNGVLIDVASGKETARLEGKKTSGPVPPFAFSRDGALLASGFQEERRQGGTASFFPAGVRVWETATGKTVAHVITKSLVGQVAFHPDNHFLVTNDLDGVQVWNTITGKRVAARRMHEQVRSSTTSGSYASCLAFTRDGHLATGHPDGTLLLWDLPLPASAAGPLAGKELDRLWTDLAGTDAARAWRAVWRLADSPQAALPLLRRQLKPFPPAPADLTLRLLAELDDKSFRRRQGATKKLKELGPAAIPALLQALQARPSVEQSKRIGKLLADLRMPSPLTAKELRELRAVTVLERIASAEARRLLGDLAKGVEAAPLTRTAMAALGRLR